MAVGLDSKQIVSSQELLMSQVVSQEAIIRLLVEKGIFTKTEYAYHEKKGEKIIICLYDSESMMVDKHLIKVWVKTIFTEAGIEQTKKEHPGAPTTYDISPRLLEINCKTKIYRILGSVLICRRNWHKKCSKMNLDK